MVGKMSLKFVFQCATVLRLPWPTASRGAGRLSCLARHDAAPPAEGTSLPRDEELPKEASNLLSYSLSHPDYFGVKDLVNLEDLFNARVHLGHKTGMWNPLMKPYLYGSRVGVHIFDLSQTLELLHTALNVTAHVAYRAGIVLFINERPQFEGLTQRAARESGEYFITQRWRGGSFTNSYMLLGTMRLPDLMIFTSVPPSKTAIKEAAMACVPSIGVLDSDCNPNLIMYPVPGNDDSPSALKLYHRLFTEAILLGKDKRKADLGDGHTANSSTLGSSAETNDNNE